MIQEELLGGLLQEHTPSASMLLCLLLRNVCCVFGGDAAIILLPLGFGEPVLDLADEVR